ncbi:hypothetical protein [Bradyrhizobium sp. BTAi1]|uniref:hypothetical protein n=1 Tax=Bradyrhizobium sp. (strain BTAi1 / ATCC BAA-1182) TaxID=288000 RepID=UPI003529516C
MDLEIISLGDRPDLIPRVFSPELDGVWPDFMRQDRTAMLYYSEAAFAHYADGALAALAGDEVVGRAFAVPFAFGAEGRSELLDAGWDEVIRWGHEDRMLERRPTTMSALEIALLPKARAYPAARARCSRRSRTAHARKVSPNCTRRCDRTRNISCRGCRCGTICSSAAPMVCSRIPGCARTSPSAARSSRSRHAR